MVNLRLLQLLTVHIATKIKYRIINKTSTIDFVEAFMICDNAYAQMTYLFEWVGLAENKILSECNP